MKNDFTIPYSEIKNRISVIQRQMQENNIDALCVLQHSDLYYFSGTAQNGLLFIPAEGVPLLFIIKYLPRAQKESPIDDIIGIRSIRDVPGLLMDYRVHNIETLAFEFDVLPVRDFEYYKTLFSAKIYVDGSGLILKTRMIKSSWEIEQMEKSAELSCRTFEYIRSSIRPGYTEIEFSGMYETFARKHGHDGFLKVRNYREKAYNWHILSGKSGGIVGILDAPASGEGTSPAFPNGAGNRIIQSNEPIMVDLGTVINGYHTDETRMFAIGSMPDEAMNACMASIDIHDYVLDRARPGIPVHELYDISVKRAETLGVLPQYLGPEDEKVIFVGHGIGLELVEQPIIARGKGTVLEPGMTLSLEPKLVYRDRFSAGIESVFAVTETGCRLISRVPVDVIIC